ncbi:MAG: NIPSNAP family protein [Planctomycetota bacterium]|nr:NIPSNAP family protein [Planctomycetaceae bacterium]MDQ3331681.1 NIPSNAP family protein [Planctomycetota bacterium]
MTRSRSLFIAGVAIAGAFMLGRALEAQTAGEKSSQRVYELRTYTANEGKFEDLHARFRDHTVKLFEKHGMTNVAYWVPADEPGSRNTLIYVLAHDSREAAKKNWEAFGKDPAWQKARAASEENGKLVSKAESVYMTPTDYSAMK